MLDLMFTWKTGFFKNAGQFCCFPPLFKMTYLLFLIPKGNLLSFSCTQTAVTYPSSKVGSGWVNLQISKCSIQSPLDLEGLHLLPTHPGFKRDFSEIFLIKSIHMFSSATHPPPFGTGECSEGQNMAELLPKRYFCRIKFWSC